MKYKGTIVEESLKDNRIVNNLRVLSIRISDNPRPLDRWHLYTVEVTKKEIRKLQSLLKSEKWYMHFWNGDDVIAVFTDKIFEFKYSDKNTWYLAVEHGKKLGIPDEQLDFVVN